MNFSMKYIYMILVVGVVVVLSIISLTLIHKVSEEERGYLKAGIIKEARAHFDSMVVSRRWNALHGGIFVNKKDGMEPNPYLKNNIKLDADGNTMIKINPAWMTRQLSELSNKTGSYYYKITSLKPINPNNKADVFESKALNYFETHKNDKFYYEFDSKFNFMGSLETEPSCLECHSYQGYDIGDIRGGIRVSVPTELYNSSMEIIAKQERDSYLVVLFISLVLILLLLSLIRLIYRYKSQREELKVKDDLLIRAECISHFGYWRLDFKDNTLIWSDELYNIFELDKNKFEPSYELFLECAHPDDKEMVMQAYTNSLEDRAPYEITHRLKMSDGPIKYVREKCETIFSEDGTPVESMGTVQDITELQTAHNNILKKDEIILVQSRHAAMGEMISMIAHQWRQPISVIAMNANNILADIELDLLNPDNLQEISEDIIYQTQELSKTIDDFKDFFKPNRDVENVFLKDIISDALNIIGKSLESNNIEMTLDIDESIEIKTFSRELMQVIINIIKNSKEALIEKKIVSKQIVIQLKKLQKSTELSISDNAGGINSDIMDKIFHPYFTTKNEKNGTGLGLYMCKTIVEKHLNGVLSISNTDEGACFKISLPNENIND